MEDPLTMAFHRRASQRRECCVASVARIPPPCRLPGNPTPIWGACPLCPFAKAGVVAALSGVLGVLSDLDDHSVLLLRVDTTTRLGTSPSWSPQTARVLPFAFPQATGLPRRLRAGTRSALAPTSGARPLVRRTRHEEGEYTLSHPARPCTLHAANIPSRAALASLRQVRSTLKANAIRLLVSWYFDDVASPWIYPANGSSPLRTPSDDEVGPRQGRVVACRRAGPATR